MAHQPKSPLLTLSSELRLRIYELALQGTTTTVQPWCKRHEFQPYLLSPLLRSCKQVYHEALLIFYEHTLFYSPHDLLTIDWLSRLHPRYRKAISEIRYDTVCELWCCNLAYGPSGGKKEQRLLDALTTRLKLVGVEFRDGVLKVNLMSPDEDVLWTAYPEKDAPGLGC